MAMSMVSSIVAPLVSVHEVDSLIRAQRPFILCHVVLADGMPDAVGGGPSGLVFACLYSPMLMYMDRRSDSGSRQALRLLVQLFMGGISTLVGNLLAGAPSQMISVGGRVNYRAF